MSHFKPHSAFAICRHVPDIDPYTNEPIVEVEVLEQTFCPVSEQTLDQFRAQYGADVWVQPTSVWS